MTQVTITPAADDKTAAPAAASGVKPTIVAVTPEPAKPAVDPNRPAWLPEKFKTPEEFAKAYDESQKKITELSQQKPVEQKPVIDASKVDMAALAKEFADNGGKLTPETLKSLETKGISSAAVDAYVEGLRAKAGALRSALVSVVGNEKTLESVYDWAGKNLSKEDIAAYNAQVNSGNTDAAKLALHGIMAKYTEANGSEAALVTGEAAQDGGIEGFASDAEVVRAMSDPRYATDEAYRASVAKRMEKTEMFSLRY